MRGWLQGNSTGDPPNKRPAQSRSSSAEEGAGFGGCTINLVRRDAVPALRDAVLRDYPARTGLTPRVFEVEASAGARRLA